MATKKPRTPEEVRADPNYARGKLGYDNGLGISDSWGDTTTTHHMSVESWVAGWIDQRDWKRGLTSNDGDVTATAPYAPTEEMMEAGSQELGYNISAESAGRVYKIMEMVRQHRGVLLPTIPDPSDNLHRFRVSVNGAPYREITIASPLYHFAALAAMAVYPNVRKNPDQYWYDEIRVTSTDPAIIKSLGAKKYHWYREAKQLREYLGKIDHRLAYA